MDTRTEASEIPPLPPGWKRVEEHKEEWEKLRREAQHLARRLAEVLVREYGARRVWLYGSAAGVWVFHDESDIDMAVEGLEDSTLWKAVRRFEKETRFAFEVWPRDWLNDRFWQRMIPRPILLCERNEHVGSGTE